MKEQLVQAIAAARAGEREKAELLLQQVLKANPRGRELTETLYWLGLLATDLTEKRRYLTHVVRLDPQHERANKQLEKLPPPEKKAKKKVAAAVTAENPICPDCGAPLFFSGDGRNRVCERCGYHQENALPVPANRIRELEASIRFAQQLSRDMDREAAFQQNLRLWLTAGLAAVKEQNVEEAYDYLSKVLRAVYATDEERIKAWLGLAELCEDVEEKRICLENVLTINPREQRARKTLAILEGRLKPDESFDPDQPTPVPQKLAVAQAQQMVCPRCGGKMQYTPDQQALECGYCHYRESLAAQEKLSRAEIGERDFLTAMFSARGHRQPVGMRIFQCQGCAVEFILVPEMLSLTCPYCQSVYVTAAAATQDTIPPDALIPPVINGNQAQEKLQHWFQTHHLERPRLLHLTGVYLPAWTFDIHGHIAWHYEVYEENPGEGEMGFGRFTPRQARWYKREDSALITEDDYLVVASHKWPEPLQKWVHEFDLAALVPYDPRYLADWPAERYQIPLGDASLKARAAIITPIKNRYTQMMEQSRNFGLAPDNGLVVEGYKLILLPLWLGHYELEGERYAVMVNGQTGMVRGLRPQGIISTLVSWFTGE
ncbi:MAG: TFIIB-type zinc finger domain-containing protein [Chloroflexi bacterium]|nr:TFIIB-type zinc finger domain-containing protein [Chloroflexota bacterium]MBP8054784.1 TFIIB-type zinc finger domain-containing protein [Chloroflexota bacterium]